MVERWIVAPEVEGSSPSIYPMQNFATFIKKWTIVEQRLQIILNVSVLAYLQKTLLLNRFYLLNELIWQDALLLDFLQKKTINKWAQKFLITSAYLFNERLVFDFLIRFGLDFFLIPLQKLSIFEVSNIINLLNWLITLILFCVLTPGLVYIGLFLI